MKSRLHLERLLIATLTLVAMAIPRVAAACPYCMTKLDRLSSTLKLVGVFLTAPFLIAGIVIWIIRRIGEAEAEASLVVKRPEGSR
jgi:hypothetical protein